MRRKTGIALAAVWGLAGIIGISWAQPAPQTINYQGRITGPGGQPPADGSTVDLTFAFYGVLSGATPLYLTVLQEDVVVKGGVYNVVIGTGTITPGAEPSLAAVFQNHQDVWLGLTVDAGAELTPRARITSAPYALAADLSYLDLDGDGHYPPGSTRTPNDDCDDGDPKIHGGVATDICDWVDNDCDGRFDEDCAQTPPNMAPIPPGCFEMGDALADGTSSEVPVHQVCLTSGFYLDEHEVTNAQYAQCVGEGSCTAPPATGSATRMTYYGDPLYDDFPVIYVDWNRASAYCLWAGKRLPSEAEWEYGARGGLAGKRYPWGDSVTGTEANYLDSGDPWDNDTSPVMSFPPNGYGLYDMAGNVMEWVNDWFTEDYYLTGGGPDPQGPPSGLGRTVRGGAWIGEAILMRVSFRAWYDQPSSTNYLGFRCAQDQ